MSSFRTTTPTSGTLTVNGMSPDEARRKRAYGYVFQAAGLYPWRTIRGNIKLPLEIMGFSKADQEERVQRVLELVELKGFGNLIAGIILLMDRSIKPGDVIAIADQTGKDTFGQIRKIGIRAVSITTRDKREYLIPNENLMTNMVENWSYSSRNVRVQIELGIAYDSDIVLAESLMLEAAKSAKRVLVAPPPAVWLN